MILENIGAEIPADGAGVANGVMTLANETRFVQGHFSHGLTSLAFGLMAASPIRQELAFLAPDVEVSPRFGFKSFPGTTTAASDAGEDDARPAGADFKSAEMPGIETEGRLANRGLTIRIERDTADIVKQAYIAMMINRLYLNDLRRAVAAFVAAATNVAFTWDTTALKDPDADILGTLDTAANAGGLYPNRDLFGGGAWKKRFLSLRGQETAGGIAGAVQTRAQLADIMGVDEVRISKARYQSTAAAAAAEVVGARVFLFYGDAFSTPVNFAHLKRFVAPLEGPGKTMRVYEAPAGAALLQLTVEQYSEVIAVSSAGAYQITVS
jgi:hypothetical protein